MSSPDVKPTDLPPAPPQPRQPDSAPPPDAAAPDGQPPQLDPDALRSAEDNADLEAAAHVPPEEEEEPEPQPDHEPEKPPRELPPELAARARAALEAMLFSSTEPVTARRLADAMTDFELDTRSVRKLALELADDYARTPRGLIIEEVAGGFQMLTHPDHADCVSRLLGGTAHAKLSQAALETLAVVAYKQPVTRADIESIRGVQAGPLLRTLLQKSLVRIVGRAELLGRPLLYGTTRKFLEHFGLKSLNELPRVEELPKP